MKSEDRKIVDTKIQYLSWLNLSVNHLCQISL